MKKIIAAALSVLMVVLAIPASVLAIMTPSDYGLGEKEDIIIHASDGDLPYDVAWNEMFPYGTFAFGEIEMNIDENGKERTYIPVYRLGGTNGRATVIIDYSPAAATLDDGSISYAYAASAKTDLRLFVEDDQPIAAYQRLGQDPMEKSPEGIKLEADYDEAAKQYTVSLAGGENTPDSYRWQYFNFSFGYWNDIAGGTEEKITIDEDYIDGENGYKNEIRLIYVEDGNTFCTPTLIFGVEYDKTEDEAKEIPEGITYIDEPTYTEITLENEYDACAFEMTFADGEWMKRIAVETIDDDVPELDEMGLFTITGCIGGVNTTVCNTLALGVLNDDEYLPSEVGFAVDSVEFDQDGGYAQVSVVRTGCLGYIVSLEYETFDETAKAGEQYAPVSGEITLAGDVDTATINIPLLAESRRESKKSFGIKLKNIRGGGNDGKCVISSDSTEVFLTSSGDAKEKGSVNLATVVVSTSGKDASGNVSVSDGTLIGGGEKVNAEALDPESKLLGGKYVYSNTYDYSDAIKFSRKSIESYDDLKFWQDYEAVTGYPRYEKAGYASLFKNATYEKNSRKPDGNTPREYFNVTDEMIEIGHNDSTITPASITISDAGRLFSRVDWYFHLPVYGIAQWDGDKRLSANDKRYVMPYIEANYKDQNWVGDFDFGFYDLSKNIDAPRKFNEYDGFDLDFSNSPFTLDINLVLHKNGQTGKTPTAPSNKCANGCTRLQLEELRMNRRVFEKTGDIGLRIFTANDSDTKGQYTELDTSSEVYSFLRPSVSIVEGAGGVDAKGRLYVGSKLYIQLNSSASYVPYSGEKADETVYLTRRDGTKVAAMVESAGSNFYYLTMLWDDMTLEDIESGEYILNVVVTRKQKISMDLSPSLLRDEDGNVRHDSESYEAALKSLVRRDDGVARKIMVVSSEFSKDEPHFKIVTNVIRADELFANVVGSSAVVNPDSDTRLHNIQSINFDLDAEDIIMFNGRIYAGDETIKLSLADLSAGNLTFRFYDAAYVDSESETAATLSHTELFYDGNGNGKIDGYFDEKIGYFIVDTSSGDYSLGMIDGQISETELDPVIDSDGTVHQYFLKVYYTVTPKSIVPKDDNLLQILPAFITAITDKEKLSLLTEEEKSYRVIQASGTKVLTFDPVTEAYGGIKEIADTSCGHAMYGAEASRMSTLDFPLGGNTRYYLNTTVTDGDGNKSTLDCTDFKGNLRIPYENPSIISKSESGSVNYEVKDVNGYLGAFVDISTFILCVQTQTEISTLDDINPETVAMGNVSTTLKPVDVTDVSEDQPGGMEFDTDGDGGSPMKELDIAAKMNLPSFSGSLTSYFNLQTLNRNQIIVSLGIPVASLSYSSKTKSSTDKDGNKVEDSEVVDSQGYKVHTKTTTKTVVDEEGNPQTVNTVETMTTKTTVETLPNGHERTIDETHMKNITDGGKASYFNEVYVVERWTDDDGEHEKVISDTVNSNPYESTAKTTYWKSKALDDMKNVNTNLADIFSKKLFTEPSQNYKDTKNGTANKFKTFALSFSIKFAALIEYDNLKGEWVFKKAIISATAAISFRFEVRFCPVVYLFIKVSFSVTVAANITFPFKKNKGDALSAIDYEKIGAKSGSVSTLKEGQWAVLVLDTDTKVDSGTALNGFSMKFKGKVNMYVAEDYTYFSDTKANSDKFITKGTLSSDGLTDTDVRLDKHTGGKLYVGICARQDTEFTDLRELFVTGRGQAFNDLAITLDLTAEAGIGFDMICFGVEVFFKFNINAIFQIAGISPVTGKRDSDVTYFNVSLALSISARFLLFSWSMDMIGVYYTVSKPYPHGPATINRGVQAFGKLKPLTASYNSVYESDDGEIRIRCNSPLNTARTQKLFGVIPSNAFTPDDYTIPFQFSGYGSTGNGIKLTDELPAGYKYKSFVVGNDSYIVYPISVGGVAGVDASQLVMSRVAVEGETTGLVNPIKESSAKPYIVIDDHATSMENTGDLEFSVDVNGSVVTVAWSGYASQAEDDNITMDEASKNTVIKTASIDLGDGTQTKFGGHETLDAEVGVYRQNPIVKDGNVFYTETNGYESVDGKIQKYAEFLKLTKGLTDEEIAKGAAAPEKAQDLFKYQNFVSVTELSGDGSTIVVKLKDGSEIRENVAGEAGEYITDMAVSESGDGYIVAYTTKCGYYFDKDGNTVTGELTKDSDFGTVKRFYVRKFGKDGFGDAVIVRTLIDFDGCYDNNISEVPLLKDGVYAGGALVETYADPQVSDLKFVNADLYGDGRENILIFNMNGNTYAFTETDIKSVIGGSKGEIKKIFTEDSGLNVTIGDDGNGKLVALYTKTVNDTSNTALYTSWWDKEEGRWGDGNILAMNHLQVYEDRTKFALSSEEAEKAYLGETTGNEEYDRYVAAADGNERNDLRGSMDYVVFENLQTAVIAKLTDDEKYENELIAFAQASKYGLTKVETEFGGEKITQVVNDGSNAKVGFYAVTFGAGEQYVAEEYLTLDERNFSAGSKLTGKVGFTNLGTASIRGSEANPITVELKAVTETVNYVQSLAKWNIYSNVPSGSEITLDLVSDSLKADLPDGTYFVLTVSEDKEYIESTGGTAYGSVSEALLTVGSSPELAIEKSEFTFARVVDDKVYYDVDIIVTNRGSEKAEGLTMQFFYEDSDGVETPLNITGSKLVTEKEAPIRVSSTLDITDDFANGVYVPKDSSGDRGLSNGYARNIHGTLCVPKNAYLEDGLHLGLRLFSENDNFEINDGIYNVTYKEQYTADNEIKTKLAQKTVFAQPLRVEMSVGATLSLSCLYNSTTDKNDIVVREISNGEESWKPILGILYFEKGLVNAVPSAIGSTVIQIEDRATNSFVEVAVYVSEKAEDINVDFENTALEFIHAENSVNANSWVMESGLTSWAGETRRAPMNGDICVATENGSKITISTTATSMVLYHHGGIEISDDTFADEMNVEYYDDWLIADFKNDGEIYHNIIITATETGTQVDRYQLTMGEKAERSILEDNQAPTVIPAHDYPKPESLALHTAVTLGAYVTDNTVIAGTAWQGVISSESTKISDNIWYLEATVNKNGVFSIEAVDANGNVTVYSYEIDWFVEGGAESVAEPPEFSSVYFTDEYLVRRGTMLDKARLYVYSVDGCYSYVYFSKTGTFAKDDNTSVGYAREEFRGYSYPVTENGFYMVTLTSRETGLQSKQILYCDNIGSKPPKTKIVQNGDKLEIDIISESNIEWIMCCAETIGSDVGKTFRMDYSIEFGGDYVFNIFNGLRIETVTATAEIPISYDWNNVSIARKDDGNKENSITFNSVDTIKGGEFNGTDFVDGKWKYYAEYEFGIAPVVNGEIQLDKATWTKEKTIKGFENECYVALIRTSERCYAASPVYQFGETLTGKVTIEGEPYSGETLTAVVENGSNTSEFRYQWYTVGATGKATAIEGANGETFVPGKNHADKKIMVEITTENEVGKLNGSVDVTIRPKVKDTVCYYDGNKHTVGGIYDYDSTGFVVRFGSRFQTASNTPPYYTEIGTYTVKYGYSTYGGVGATAKYDTATVTILPKAINDPQFGIEVIFDNPKQLYTGKPLTANVLSATIDGLDFTFEAYGKSATEVGKHTVVITGTGNYSGSITTEWEIVEFGGEVTLDADKVKVGDTIKAEVNANVEDGFVYQWYRYYIDNPYVRFPIEGANASEYTVKGEDALYYLECEVSHESLYGSIPSGKTDVVTFDANDYVGQYDGKRHTISFDDTYGVEIVYGDIDDPTPIPKDYTDVCDRKIKYYLVSEGGNYVECEASVKINPRIITPMNVQVTLKENKTVYEYSGDEINLIVSSVKYDNIPVDYYIVSGNSGKDVGPYELVIAGKGNFEGKVTIPWDIIGSPIKASVSVSGKLMCGETLTASVENANTENYVYQWCRYTGTSPKLRQEISGANGQTYTLTKDDIGCNIVCVLKSPEKDGYVSSERTDWVHPKVVGCMAFYDGQPHGATVVEDGGFDVEFLTESTYTEIGLYEVRYRMSFKWGNVLEGSVKVAIMPATHHEESEEPESSEVESSEIESSEVESSEVESSEVESSEVESSDVESSEVESSDVESSEAESSEAEITSGSGESESSEGKGGIGRFLPYILGGIGALLILFLIILLKRRKDDEEEENKA